MSIIIISAIIAAISMIGYLIYRIANDRAQMNKWKAEKKAAEEQIRRTREEREKKIFYPDTVDSNGVEIDSVKAILSSVDEMDGREFENWCSELLKKIGFNKALVTKASGDQGVDIVAEKDGERYAIQCKRYSGRLGNSPIQEVFAGKTLYDCAVAVVVTNNYFTDPAINMANSLGVKLWDRDALVEILNYLFLRRPDTKEQQCEELQYTGSNPTEFQDSKKRVFKTENGSFEVRVKAAHWESWNGKTESSEYRILSIDFIVENLDYEHNGHGVCLTDFFSIKFDDKYRYEYYPLQGPNKDLFPLNHITKKGEISPVRLTWILPVDCTSFSIVGADET